MDEKTISVALTEDDWYLLLRTLAAVKKCAPMSLEIALNCISHRIKTGLEEEKNKILSKKTIKV